MFFATDGKMNSAFHPPHPIREPNRVNSIAVLLYGDGMMARDDGGDKFKLNCNPKRSLFHSFHFVFSNPELDTELISIFLISK